MTSRTSETPPPHVNKDNGPLNTNKLPHYTRLFTAPIIQGAITLISKSVVWIMFLLVVAVNIHMAGWRIPFASFDARSPYNNTSTQAPLENVLGVSRNTKNTQQQTNDLQHAYEYWEAVIVDHPDYRDAHIQAALVAFQLGRTAQYYDHLKIARSLDPNYPGISSLEDLKSHQ